MNCAVRGFCQVALFVAALHYLELAGREARGELPRIQVSQDGRSFCEESGGRKFIPWGFNYDHDGSGRLIEDYWDEHWDTVVEDFLEMKQLGANVVRIHLQLGKFMQSADRSNPHSLAQLGRLLKLAEETGLYIDLTGLGCYHKKDVPAWYDALSEPQRWDVQAEFWEAVAKRCAGSPAVFCYDLMNEPVTPNKQKRDDWLAPAFAGKHFVQFVALEAKDRPRHEIAQKWVGKLAAAIRKQDRRHLVTVGLVPWSLDRPGLSSGFIPEKIAGDLDFIAVHIYPEKDKLDEAVETLKGFAAVGKPVVIEEMFPLKCSAAELSAFIDASRADAAGWIGFYWGQTPEEYRKSDTMQSQTILSWLELFQEKRKMIVR